MVGNLKNYLKWWDNQQNVLIFASTCGFHIGKYLTHSAYVHCQTHIEEKMVSKQYKTKQTCPCRAKV